MLIRIDVDLKARLTRLARAEGKTTSRVVRELIRNYVKERDIGAYIDGLWDRIGAKLKAGGRGRAPRKTDIEKTITDVRKARG
jgi:predicted transcriptional regulator